MANKKVVIFTCNWNAYSGLEQAGLSHMGYSSEIMPVKIMCLGRLHSGNILKAFENGADGVLLLGCPPEKCNYEFGNRSAEEVYTQASELLHLLGFPPERLGFDSVEAGQGDELVEKITTFVQKIY